MTFENVYEDPNYSGNSSEHHTGKKCVTKGCDKPAGTTWSPFWCQACNAKRLSRISANLAIAESKLDFSEDDK